MEDLNLIQIILIAVVAIFAGFESVLDEWQLHQPIITVPLIGLITGNFGEALILGGQLQLIVMGWMNIGAAMAPDTALAGIVSGILVLAKGASISEGIAIAIPLAIAGQLLTIFVRTLAVGIMHRADTYAEEGNVDAVSRMNLLGMLLQGLRVALPALAVIMVPAQTVTAALNTLPDWLTGGLAVGGGMIVAVGYAMVINMMASVKSWPFFFIGFALSAITDLNLVAMGIIGASLALIYIQLAPQFSSTASISANGSTEDALDQILDDY